MSDYYLFHDSAKCIGCLSCEAHCKEHKRLPQGPRLCRVETIGPKWVGTIPRMDFVFMPCYHCDNPWCVAACPTGAMQKRAKDGIVFVERDRCVGCKACMRACPWGAPQWDPEKGKVVKCDYCVERVDQGLEPACVAKCVTGCLHFGKPAEVTDARRGRHARALAAMATGPSSQQGAAGSGSVPMKPKRKQAKGSATGS